MAQYNCKELEQHEINFYYRYQLEEDFEEMLNDCYEPYSILGMTFHAGKIIKACDPVCFELMFFEYIDQDYQRHVNEFGIDIYIPVDAFAGENAHLAA